MSDQNELFAYRRLGDGENDGVEVPVTKADVARARAEQGSARAARKWSVLEKAAVDAAILRVAHDHLWFTADHVWRALPDGFPVTKGLASRLMVAARKGYIEATDQFEKAQRGGEHDHAQTLRLWHSNRYQKAA